MLICECCETKISPLEASEGERISGVAFTLCTTCAEAHAEQFSHEDFLEMLNK